MIGIPYRLAALVLALTLSHGWAWYKGHSQANASRDAAEAVAERVRMAATMRNVRKAATAEPQASGIHGHNYIFGVDWGRSGDFTCVTILDLTLNAVVAIDRFNQIDYTIQAGRVQALAERFKPLAIVAESNSMGLPIIEQLRRKGLPMVPFQTTNASKQIGIDALALAFEQGQIRIIPDETLIGELEAYTSEKLPSGMIRYGAPEGAHDDLVISTMLAWYGAGTANRKRASVREY